MAVDQFEDGVLQIELSGGVDEWIEGDTEKDEEHGEVPERGEQLESEGVQEDEIYLVRSTQDGAADDEGDQGF